MTKDEALKQALEALKHVEHVYCVTYEEAVLAIEQGLAQPAREKLTEAEIWQMVNDCMIGGDLHAIKFARAIEAAQGIGKKT